MDMNFTDWLGEWADYGFDRDLDEPKDEDDQKPYDPISADIIIQELLSLGKIGTRQAHHTWQDVIEYGSNDVGTLAIDITPLGSFKVITRRKITTLQGESAWICKHVLSLNEHNYADRNEVPIAHKIYSTLEEIDNQLIEKAQANYPDFKKLSQMLTRNSSRLCPEGMFYKGVKEIDENHVITYFEFRGGGVGGPDQSRIEQFNIHLYFDQKKGLIRSWGHDVSSTLSQHEWSLNPSEWDEYFAPTQNLKEIVSAIVGAFRTY